MAILGVPIVTSSEVVLEVNLELVVLFATLPEEYIGQVSLLGLGSCFFLLCRRHILEGDCGASFRSHML